MRWQDAAPADSVAAVLELEVAGQAWRIERELRGRSLVPQATLHVNGVAVVAPGAGSSDAVSGEVERRLGLARDAFFTTVVARQRELAGLAGQRPAERRRLLLGMLGVDAVDRAVAAARERRRAVEEGLRLARSMLADPAAVKAELAKARERHQACLAASAAALDAWQAAQRDLARAQEELDAREADESSRQEALRSLSDAQREADRLSQALASVLDRLAGARAASEKGAGLGDTASHLTSSRAALQEAERIQFQHERHGEAVRAAAAQRAQAESLRQAPPPPPGPAPDLAAAAHGLEAAEDSLRAAEAEVAKARARRDHAQGHLAGLGRLGPRQPCPTCERPLEGHLDALVDRLRRDLEGLEAGLASKEEALRRARSARAEAAARRDDALRRDREHQREALAHEAWKARLAQEEERASAAASLVPVTPPPRPDVEHLAAAARAAEARHEEAIRLRTLAGAVPGLAEEERVARLALDEAIRRVAAARVAADRHGPGHPGRLEAARQAHALLGSAERRAEVTLHAAVGDERVSAASVAAAQARGEETARQAAAAAAAEAELARWTLLVGAAGGGLLERFREHLAGRIGPALSREASHLLARFTGGRYTEVLLDDAFEIYVTDGGVPYTIDRLSGGQADLVHLALRLAVSRLLAHRGRAEIRFLALDEVFGSLDREHRGHVLAALGALGGLYGQVLLVTHLEELEDALDQCLRIDERDGRAAVRLHKG